MVGKGNLLWRIFSKHRLDSNDEVDKVRASVSELRDHFCDTSSPHKFSIGLDPA